MRMPLLRTVIAKVRLLYPQEDPVRPTTLLRATATAAALLVVPALVAAPASGTSTVRADAAPRYTVELLDPLPGGDVALALGLATNGTVVGTSRTSTASRPQVAAAWQGDDVRLLGTLPGSTFSRAFAVNARGQAVGEAFTPSPEVSRAVLWERDGTIRDLGTLGGPSAVANDVDERGRAFGVSSVASGPITATVWDADGPRALPLPAGAVAGAGRVNAVTGAGTAVGTVTVPTATGTVSRPVRWDGRGRGFAPVLLDQLEPDRFATAFGVSVDRVVVGEATRLVPGTTGTVTRAVRWDGTGVTELDGLRGYRFTRANDVSAHGEVVGHATGFLGFPSIDGAAVLWLDEAAHDLNDLTVDLPDDVVLRNAEAVDDQGRIAGFATVDGRNRPFVLTPVDGR
jgi:probable HAF family extracellular repeat protein